MIILALIRIARGKGEGHPPLAQLSGIRNLFGVCVYSFMCQHSLPSLITPISKKKHINKLVLLDYIMILGFYGLLSFTAIYCFRNGTLMDMYTLNFTNCSVVNVAFIRYFLGLFPVFTISTNFPIIARLLDMPLFLKSDGGDHIAVTSQASSHCIKEAVILSCARISSEMAQKHDILLARAEMVQFAESWYFIDVLYSKFILRLQ
ncbi:hypothetical protein lerEdw1_017763 [Lerista edwardsae]|nr:hypothetical protein lerEdw1_017763 [Lerista edwardsae]